MSKCLRFASLWIPLVFLGVHGVKKSEEKDAVRPVHRLNHNENNIPNDYLHKRQISPQLQSFDPQFFQPSFDPAASNGNGPAGQFRGPLSQDEEERFFLSGEEPTTLNPLAFLNPPTTSNPIQQQLVNEQRQFQQEIADRGLREQQQRAFGLPQPTTTSPNSNSQLVFQPNSFANQPASSPDPNNQFSFQPNSFLNQPANSPNLDGQFAFPPDSFQFQRTPQDIDQPFGTQFSSFSQLPSQSFSNVRTYRRKRAIDRQLSSSNDLRFFPSTVRPEAFVDNFLHDHPNPRSDLAQIGSWLIGNLAKQLEKNLAHLTESTAKPKLQYSTPSIISTESPTNLIPVSYQQPLKVESRIPWNTLQSTPEPSVSPLPWNQPGLPYLDQPKPDWNLATPAIPPNPPSPWTVAPQTSTPPEYHRIRNVQILPTSTPSENLAINPYDSTVFQAYQQIYNVDHQSTKPVESTTTFAPLINNQPTTDVSIDSLFRTKLNAFKKIEIPQSSPQPGYSEFQQSNRFFDLLQQSNSTVQSVTESSSLPQQPTGISVNPGTAIFIKMPDEEPTSTVGYLFDKTISAKRQHKKESYDTKKNSRSAQVIKSSLVYRTPPGKRATVSRAELMKNSQIEAGLLSNFLEPGRPVFRLLAQTRPTTTTRPLVTALWNLIQNRSPFN